MSAFKTEIIPFSPELYTVERKAAKIDNVSFNFFSDTRLCIMDLVLEPRQQDSGLIRFLIELNLKSGLMSSKLLGQKDGYYP